MRHSNECRIFYCINCSFLSQGIDAGEAALSMRSHTMDVWSMRATYPFIVSLRSRYADRMDVLNFNAIEESL